MPTSSEGAPAYHPHQLFVCGYSGAGKTTLITKLIARLTDTGLAVGYGKHDGHRFQLEQEGKDTGRAYGAGAHLVTINDADHRATFRRSPDQLPVTDSCDLMLIEGHKNAPGPKVLVVADGDSFEASVWQGVLFVVGAAAKEQLGIELAAELQARNLPYWQRDNDEGIAAEILAALTPKAAPVGIVLAGGKSRRMGRDKGLIDYHGKPQALHLAGLLSHICSAVAISANHSHYEGTGYQVLADRLLGFGPLGALATAMAAFPGQPLLVVACDLPFVTHEAIAALLAGRQPLKAATCFASADRGLPEPMFAIYEPRLQPRLWRSLAAMAAGTSKGCARKLLLSAPIALLPAVAEVNLANANHPSDYDQAKAAIKEMR